MNKRAQTHPTANGPMAAIEHTRKLYAGAAFTAPWSDGLAIKAGVRDALTTLMVAAGRTYDEDIRTPEVRAALDFLGGQNCPRSATEAFWRALDTKDPCLRFEATERALKSIRRRFGAG